MLSVQVGDRASGSGVIITLVGRLVDRTAEALRRSLSDALDRRPVRLLIDLGRLHTMTSVGERLLIDALRQARSRSVALAVSPGTEHMRRRFADNGFDQLVPILSVEDWSRAGVAE